MYKTQWGWGGLVWEALGDFAQTYIPIKQHKCSNSLAAFWSPRSLLGFTSGSDQNCLGVIFLYQLLYR